MSSITTPQPVPPGLLAVASFFRLSVDEYHEMIRNNILTTDDRVELLDGYLVNKMPQNTPHGSTVERLTEDLNRAKPAGWRVRIQLPITLPNSEPEPDAAMVRGSRHTFDARHPSAADFGVVMEVSDSSLALDRGPKARLYAEAGIPEYWIINLPDRQIEVYTNPNPVANPPAYLTRKDYTIADTVALILDTVTVATITVSDLIP